MAGKAPPLKIQITQKFRVTAYLPTYPLHHPRFTFYLKARETLERTFCQLYRGVTTLEGTGLYLPKENAWPPDIDTVFVIYGYVEAEAQDIHRFAKGLTSKLHRILPDEQAFLLTYHPVTTIEAERTTSRKKTVRW